MRRLLPLLPLALLLLATGAQAFTNGSLRLVYSETSGDSKTTKEYLVCTTPGGGWHLDLFNQGIKRSIDSDPDLNTTREEYHNPATGDDLTISRHDQTLRLTGTLDHKPVDRSFPIDAPWYGSVLLLRDFVLSGQHETLFYVTKPEEEKVVLLKAIREDTETVSVNGTPTQTVRIRYTVPGFKGMFWHSLYWYRTTDGLLVKTEETRGGPGTPKVFAELLHESDLPIQGLSAQR